MKERIGKTPKKILITIGLFSAAFIALIAGAGFRLAGVIVYSSVEAREAALMKEANKCLELPGNNDQSKCLNDFLSGTTIKHGVKPALKVIETLSTNNSRLLQWAHPFSHTIGRSGLKFYMDKGLTLAGAMGRSLVECDGYGAFGCYHGVIEVGLSRLKVSERTPVIRQACLEDPLIQSSQYYINQCLHWFGHGAAIFANMTLDDALEACNGLSPNFQSDEVQLCLSGLFHAGSAPGESDDELLHNISNVYKEGEPYYPCSDVEEKYRAHCYGHAFGRARAKTPAEGFKVCDGIPETDPRKREVYVRACYDSAANYWLELTLAEKITDEEKIDKMVAGCRDFSSPQFRKYCYGGVSRYWVLRDPLITNLKPFSFCRKVEEESKSTCYGAIGFGNNENYYSEEKIRNYCGNAEKEYFYDCLSKKY